MRGIEAVLSAFHPYVPMFLCSPRGFLMSQHRYHLDTNSRNKIACPNCKKAKRFSKYIDTEGEIEFPDDIGRCDRINNCGYHMPPREYFEQDPDYQRNKEDWTSTEDYTQFTPPPKWRIPYKIFEQSLKGYKSNNFACWLQSVLTPEAYQKVIEDYKLGTTRNGDTVFWLIDKDGDVRSGQIIKYDIDGHRTNSINWVHSLLKKSGDISEEFELQQCFFGLHLVAKYPDKPIAIVEAPKTAIICSAIYPQYVWLSSVGIGGLSLGKILEIGDNKVIVLYPDKGEAFRKWRNEVDTWANYNLEVSIDDSLELESIKNGGDLVDYFEKHLPIPWRALEPENSQATGTNQSKEKEIIKHSQEDTYLSNSANHHDVIATNIPENLTNALGLEIECITRYDPLSEGLNIKKIEEVETNERTEEKESLIRRLQELLDSGDIDLMDGYQLKGVSLNGYAPRTYCTILSGRNVATVMISRLKLSKGSALDAVIISAKSLLNSIRLRQNTDFDTPPF
jgi:hypothetical protein